MPSPSQDNLYKNMKGNFASAKKDHKGFDKYDNDDVVENNMNRPCNQDFDNQEYHLDNSSANEMQ